MCLVEGCTREVLLSSDQGWVSRTFSSDKCSRELRADLEHRCHQCALQYIRDLPELPYRADLMIAIESKIPRENEVHLDVPMEPAVPREERKWNCGQKTGCVITTVFLLAVVLVVLKLNGDV